MATLLFECFSEEMPARMQRGAREQLQQLLTKALAAGNITHGDVRTFASPRHLAIQIDGLPNIQPDVTVEKKGPKLGAPQAAIDGFLKSTGLTSLDACEQRTVGKDTVYFATITTKGRPMAEWLKDALDQLMRDFTWPKSMRWGDHKNIQWVRPLHRLVCLLDSTPIPVQFGHITASNITEGHRFLAPAPITLKHANDYVSALEKAHVMVDADARRDAIYAAATSAAAAQQLQLVDDAGLLDEVTGLVEWPFCYVGTFDAAFMPLPREVLTSEMRHHQKYFALQKPSGELSNHFIITANMKATDGGTAIKHGNARVLRARLEDGKFYWNMDRHTRLDEWAEKLRDVVFHARVGMMNEKVARIVALAETISESVPGADKALVKRAAELCKADLTTGMVGEFPDLQGIMGRYYALQQNETPEVADAIRDHYKPVGASDDVPTHPIAICVALADKLDSITSLFAAGEKPTGSKDPLALRRAALGVLRIILSNKLEILLDQILKVAVLTKPDGSFETPDPNKHSERLLEVKGFLLERLKVILRDEGLRHDVIYAAIGLHPSQSAMHIMLKPTLIRTRALAVQYLVTSESGAPILAAYKRATNILTAEEKKDKTQYSFSALNPALLTEPQEIALHTALLNARKEIEPHLKAERFSDALAVIANLNTPLTAFFDAILVNAEDKAIRTNRLSLLALIRETMHSIADFSAIEG